MFNLELSQEERKQLILALSQRILFLENEVNINSWNKDAEENDTMNLEDTKRDVLRMIKDLKGLKVRKSE